MTTRIFADQSARTKIEVHGVDASAFLHNLSSNDVKNLPVGGGLEAFLLNAQARVLAWVRIFKIVDGLWIDADPGLGRKIISHLERYVITEDVQLTEHTGDYAQFLVDAALLERLDFLGLDEDLQISAQPWHGERCYVWRNDAIGTEAYEVVVPVGLREHLVKRLSDVVPRTAEECEYLRIAAGVPVYGIDITDANLPQEVNRDSRVLSFTKGCYLGQEPVVRIRDLGHVNRKLVRLRLEGSTPVVTGAKIECDGMEVGQVTSAASGDPTVALGYVRRGHWESGTQVMIVGAPGVIV